MHPYVFVRFKENSSTFARAVAHREGETLIVSTLGKVLIRRYEPGSWAEARAYSGDGRLIEAHLPAPVVEA